MLTATTSRKALKLNATLAGGGYTTGRSSGRVAGNVGKVAYTVTLPTGDTFKFTEYQPARKCWLGGEGRGLTATNTVTGEAVTVWNSTALRAVLKVARSPEERRLIMHRLILPEWAR
jgi:hypothetical protein